LPSPFALSAAWRRRCGVNEVDHVVPHGESKTDYMGRFIMRLKQLADDYELLMIACAHPPKDGVEKRMSKSGLLTLNDGADTAHWGNKADIGWCAWRTTMRGPTLLHVDKLKNHEAMGEPTLAELHLDKALGRFDVMRTGYDILRDD
jgi:twinkle protein